MSVELSVVIPATNWRDGPMAAFDTETTGPDPLEARIVSASIILVSAAGVLERRSWLINPGVEIPAEATAVHGITTERARTEGIEPRVGIGEISAALCRAAVMRVPLVAMNARYDLLVHRCEVARHRLPPVEIGPVLDPQTLDRGLDRYRKGKRKLVDLAATYGVRIEDAHSSDGDALAAARIVWKQVRRPELRNLSLADLQAYQARVHAEWAANYQQYRRRNGEPDCVINPEWP